MNSALAYAERDLGVHKVWVNAEQLCGDIAAWYSTLAGLEAGVRRINREIEECKDDIIVLLHGQEFTSQAAFDRAYKHTTAADEHLRQLENRLLEEMSQRDLIHMTIKGAENNLKAHVARMDELGGYLHYLAAVKQAQVNAAQEAAKATQLW